MKQTVTGFLCFVVLATAYGLSRAQSIKSPADPYGLKWIGMPKRLEKHPIVSNPAIPPNATVCGPGVFFLKAEKSYQNKMITMKFVVITFEPSGRFELSPDPVRKFQPVSGDYSPIYTPPPGHAALTLVWPPPLRSGQRTRFQWVGTIGKDETDMDVQPRVIEVAAEVDLKEGKDSWLSRNIDTHLGQNALVTGGPLLLNISLPKD